MFGPGSQPSVAQESPGGLWTAGGWALPLGVLMWKVWGETWEFAFQQVPIDAALETRLVSHCVGLFLAPGIVPDT